jgi:transposase InsO family protein
MKDPGEWKNKYQAAHGSLSDMARYAGQVWQMDSTPADVMTNDKNRCAIVAGIDIYSRRVVCVAAPTSKAEVIALTMRKGMLLWGVPEKLLKDNGQDYSSVHIKTITAQLNIECPKLHAYASEEKGNIERFFGTLCRDLEERLPGFTGHSVPERAAIQNRQHWAKRILHKQPGDDPVEIPISMAELQNFIDEWLIVYESRTHTGFENDRDKSKRGLSPLQAYEQSKRKAPVIRDVRSLDILLIEQKDKKITKKGIRLNNCIYTHPLLVDKIGWIVDVKVNPDDISQLYVFHKNHYICTATDEALVGVKKSEYYAARNRDKKKMKSFIDGSKQMSQALDISYTADISDGSVRVSTTDEKEAAKKVIEFRQPLITPALTACEDLIAEKDGLPRPLASPSATDSGKVIDFTPPETETIYPVQEEEEDEWEHYPFELLNNVIHLYEWYQAKERHVPLTTTDIKHMEFLRSNYPEINMMLNQEEIEL